MEKTTPPLRIKLMQAESLRVARCPRCTALQMRVSHQWTRLLDVAAQLLVLRCLDLIVSSTLSLSVSWLGFFLLSHYILIKSICCCALVTERGRLLWRRGAGAAASAGLLRALPPAPVSEQL